MKSKSCNSVKTTKIQFHAGPLLIHTIYNSVSHLLLISYLIIYFTYYYLLFIYKSNYHFWRLTIYVSVSKDIFPSAILISKEYKLFLNCISISGAIQQIYNYILHSSGTLHHVVQCLSTTLRGATSQKTLSLMFKIAKI